MTTKERQSISENMRYSDFDENTIAQYLRLRRSEKTDEALRLLSCQRCKLLKIIHSDQKKLDALDYLIYQTKNTKEL